LLGSGPPGRVARRGGRRCLLGGNGFRSARRDSARAGVFPVDLVGESDTLGLRHDYSPAAQDRHRFAAEEGGGGRPTGAPLPATRVTIRGAPGRRAGLPSPGQKVEARTSSTRMAAPSVSH
jgi:hypothetical protein